MAPREPFSTRSQPGAPSGPLSARSSGGLQRDLRLRAALALLVGTGAVAIPISIVYKMKRAAQAQAHAAASTSASLSALEDAGPPTVIFGDAGATVSVDAGGRSVTFGEPRYLRCQDPGAVKTPPERCDHLGAIEELVTKAITDRVAACVPASPNAAILEVRVDASFKRHKVVVTADKIGSTMPAAQRKKAIDCIAHGMPSPAWDTVAHAHQRYTFSFLATFGPAQPPPSSVGGGAPVGLPPLPANPP